MIFTDRYGVNDPAEERELNKLAMLVLETEPAWGAVHGRWHVRPDHKTPLLSLAMLRGGVITLGVNWNVWREISFEARMEAFVQAGHRLLTGCIGSLGEDIRAACGPEATELALLTILHKVPTPNLALYGFAAPTPKDLDLPDDVDWITAARKIRQLIDSQKMKVPPPDAQYNSAKDVQDMDEDGYQVVPGESGMDEEVQADPKLADEVMRSLMKKMEERYNAKARGLFGGQYCEMIENLYAPPVVQWQEKYRWTLEAHGKALRRRTLKRPSRRCTDPGFKGVTRRGRCVIYNAIDTSGSRSNKAISTAFPEMRAASIQGATNFWVQVDAEIQRVERWDGTEEHLEVLGRGGTDIQPVFDQMREINARTGTDPDLVVIFTDGYIGNLNCGEYPTLILLDPEGMGIDEFTKLVSGDDIEIAVLDDGGEGQKDL